MIDAFRDEAEIRSILDDIARKAAELMTERWFSNE